MPTPSRILITGGAGFVGSNLACRLAAEFSSSEIVCMDSLYRRGSELNLPRLAEVGAVFHKGDIRSPDDFPAGCFDLLIECSAEPSVLAGTDGSPDYLFETNLTGAYRCLEKAREWNAAFLFLSTSRVYPIHRLESHPWTEEETRFAWHDTEAPGIGALGVSEDLPLDGARSLYGFTKLAAEQLIEEYRTAFGLRSIINRCGVIAGPWQFGKVDQGVIALWVMAHLFGKPLSYIGYGGHGKQVRDVLHIDDLCDLVSEQIRDFDAWEGWNGNVAGGFAKSVSLLELTRLCREVTGKETSISSTPATRPFDLRIFIGNCDRLHATSPWRPKRDVRTTVADVAQWVSAHESDLRKIA